MFSDTIIVFKETKEGIKGRYYCYGLLSAAVVVINYCVIFYSSFLGNLPALWKINGEETDNFRNPQSLSLFMYPWTVSF